MNRLPPKNRLILGAAAAVALIAGGEARASVTVIGGGLAEACSRAALSGKSGIRREDPCTEALEKEMLTSRARAGPLVNRGVLKMRRTDWKEATADFNEA